MFAGEFYDGSKVVVYNEAYRWNIDRNEWRRVECPVSPKPRCSHQAVFFKDSVFCFGGEFSTVDQFYHFRDLWRFHLKTNTWEEVQCTGVGPSARSGHRMVCWFSQRRSIRVQVDCSTRVSRLALCRWFIKTSSLSLEGSMTLSGKRAILMIFMFFAFKHSNGPVSRCLLMLT